MNIFGIFASPFWQENDFRRRDLRVIPCLMQELRIAIVGHRFMGRAHSNAWNQVSRFFDPAVKPVMQVACGRDEKDLTAFAQRWGWAEIETDWRRLLERDDIDAIDIATPTFLHAEMAIAAAEAGKHIFCEKPFANTLAEGEAMLAAAEKAGVVHYLNHNYRRCPAVLLAGPWMAGTLPWASTRV